MSDIKIRYLWIEVPPIAEILEEMRKELMLRTDILIKQEICKSCMKVEKFIIEDVKIKLQRTNYVLYACKKHTKWNEKEKEIEELVEDFYKSNMQSSVSNQPLLSHICEKEGKVLKTLLSKINKLSLEENKSSIVRNSVKKTRRGKKKNFLKKFIYSRVLKSLDKTVEKFCIEQYCSMYLQLGTAISELENYIHNTYLKDMETEVFEKEVFEKESVLKSILNEIMTFTYYMCKKTLRYEDIEKENNFNVSALESQLAACSLVNDVSATLRAKRTQSNHIS